jgi:uncharacterized membrane protein
MLDFLINAVRDVPPQLATVLLATLPVGELRGALPIALLVYKLPVFEAVVLSIFGNMLPVYFLLMFFEGAARWISKRSKLAERLLEKMYERTRLKLHDQVRKYGYWALMLFVAIPLPVTGAWTGTLAAFVFGLPRKKSFIAILIGVCISSLIVTGLTLGAFSAVASVIK